MWGWRGGDRRTVCVLTAFRLSNPPPPPNINTHHSHTPFWDRGITGSGVTVGVADSGLDHQSCYFYDSANKVNFGNNVNVGGRTIGLHENLQSRKVVQYVG